MDVGDFVVVSVAAVESIVVLIDVNLSWSPEASSFVSSFFSVEVNWAKWNGTGPFSQGKKAHQLNLILMRLSDSLSRCVDHSVILSDLGCVSTQRHKHVFQVGFKIRNFNHPHP